MVWCAVAKSVIDAATQQHISVRHLQEQVGDADESREVQGIKTSAAGSSIATAVWKTVVPARESPLEALIHGDQEFSVSLERPADGAAGDEAAASASDRNTRTSAG